MKEKEIRENLNNDKFLIQYYRIDEDVNVINGFEINKEYNYDQAKMIKAIKNGMVMKILYKGEEDNWKGGRERTIAPVVLGINKNTKNILCRAWHIEGRSVREKQNVEKVWRLFNVDNIKKMSFTGNYIQLAPKGYRLNDRIMTERTIVKADFNEIRRNQNNLVQKGIVEVEEEVDMSGKNNKIKVEETDAHIDLVNPWNNDVLRGRKNQANEININILKHSTKNEWLCIVGGKGTVNTKVTLYKRIGKIIKRWRDTKMGIYLIKDSFTADQFNQHKHVMGISQMPIYIYKGKRNF